MSATSRELLFEYQRGHEQIRCELLDHGEANGIEAQFFHDGLPQRRQWFTPRRHLEGRVREMAIGWANGEREAIERRGHTQQRSTARLSAPRYSAVVVREEAEMNACYDSWALLQPVERSSQGAGSE